MLAQCGFQPQDILDQPHRWVDLGHFLGDSLGIGGWEQLNDFERCSESQGRGTKTLPPSADA